MTAIHAERARTGSQALRSMSDSTKPPSMKPNMAVMCAIEPLICAFDEHHS